ncbi:MAG: pitrilysin family protein [Bacillota bacterium]
MCRKQVLQNGVRIVAENILFAHSAVIGIWIKSGSRYEDDTNRGVSHFIEHLLFKGTSNRTAKQIAEELEALGGTLNAFTSKEYTCFYAKVLAIHLPKAIDLLSDMIFNSNFAEEDIKKEKNVVLEEIKMYEDTPDEYIHDLFVSNVWQQHALGYPVLGTSNSIENVDKKTIIKYFNEHYTPANTVIAVAGNIDYQEVFSQLEKTFGGWDSPQTVAGKLIPPVVTRKDVFYPKETEQVHFCVGTPSIAQDDERIYVMTVLNSAIGGGLSSRLFQTIREEKGLVYSIFSYNASYTGAGLFSVYAGTRSSTATEVLDLILKELKKIQKDGITQEELKRIQTQVEGNILLSTESVSNRMSRLGKSELSFNRVVTGQEVIKKIFEVTLSDIYLLAKELFRGENFSYISLGPEKLTTEFPQLLSANLLL